MALYISFFPPGLLPFLKRSIQTFSKFSKRDLPAVILLAFLLRNSFPNPTKAFRSTISRDSLMEYLLGATIEIVKWISVPTCRCIDDHRKLEERMNDLGRISEVLTTRKRDVEARVKAELKWGKIIKEEVDGWLQDARRINEEIQLLRQNGQVVSYFGRARLGKRIAHKIVEVEQVYERGSFYQALVMDKAPAVGVIFQLEHLEGESVLKDKLWGFLMGDEIGKIGVCGMGGIGKTTVMKHISNLLLEESRFDKVIWVTVSRQLNVSRLQRDIVKAMNEDLPGNESEWATVLMDMLGNKRFVLIFDDVWEWFSLKEVGIPEHALNNGSKLILTSRSVDVCLSIGCEVVKMQPLSTQESFNLFLDNVGHGILKFPALEKIAAQIVKECAGLPLAVVTIARSMRGVYDVHEWKNTQKELCERVKSVKGTDIEIFEPLMFSYSRLEDPKLQNCFLYCSLYPEDQIIPRKELIECWIDEEFIDELESREAMHDRGHAILHRLENNCLLESVEDKDCVKMHDVLRDMALHITSSPSPRYMVKAGTGLMEAPSERQWTEDLQKVSLTWNYISKIPNNMSIKCPLLSTLLLRGNPYLKNVDFIENLQGLKILDLSYCEIYNLPHCISNLENLTALVLKKCEMITYVPPLTKLRALRKLDLHGTRIWEIPQGMDMLVNLTYLDLYSYLLRELPTGLLPKLSHLQHLVVCWKWPNLEIKGEEAIGLRRLETFVGRFSQLEDFNMFIQSIQGKKLTLYMLSVGSLCGHSNFWMPEDLKDNTLLLSGCNIGEYPIMLPNDLCRLTIEACKGRRSLCTMLLFENYMTELRRFDITHCQDIECLLDLSSSTSSKCILQNLEIFSATRLDNLHELVRLGEAGDKGSSSHASPPPTILPRSGIFSCLKEFIMYTCGSLKKLFPFELVKDLQNLEHLKVEDCWEMEEIIGLEEVEEAGDAKLEMITLPKLKKLSLLYLPKLKRICSRRKVMICDSLQQITVVECLKLGRIPLHLPLLDNGEPSPPPFLQGISVNPIEWWELVQWDHPNAKNVLLQFLNYWDMSAEIQKMLNVETQRMNRKCLYR